MNYISVNPSHSEQIRDLYLGAFDETEREVVAELAVALLSEESDPETIHLAAEQDDKLIGHVSFSPVYEKVTQKHIGYILAPLAVLPAWQKSGIGSTLVKEGLGRLKLQEVGTVFVYGDPSYYNRFGFKLESAANFIPPHPLTYPDGWLALCPNAYRHEHTPVHIECLDAFSSPEIW